MANEITLSRAWKQSLTTSKMQPFAMQVSLWDLLFFVNPSREICTRYIQAPIESNWKCKGYELPHSIIVFDEKIYTIPEKTEEKIGRRILKKGYSTNTEQEIEINNLTTFDKWSSLGFDISLPWFDVRNKPLFLKRSNFSKFVQESNVTDFNNILNTARPKKLDSSDFYFIGSEQTGDWATGFKIWDKDAALKPKTSYDFYIRSAIKPDSMLKPNEWEDYPDPWYIAPEDDWADLWTNSVSSKNPGTSGADIILCNKDTVFEKRFILPESKLSAYNGICLNFNSKRIWRNFLKYYSAQISDFDPYSFIIFSNEYTVSTINPIFSYLLKHCYIWFKCAFFADYVDYRDFNQSLNEKSQVIHKDLILGQGDFKRYEELYSQGLISSVDRAKNTRPYFPTTTPIKDRVKETLLLESELINGNFNTIMNNIIENASSPESKIGSLATEPFEDTGNSDNTSPPFTTKAIIEEPPPIWFDPESRKVATDYNDYPILMGKDGNLITIGRLLSPTIDELWQTIKELIAGKKSDTANNTIDDFGGYPRNTTNSKITTIDSRLKLPEHRFKNNTGDEKIGDPTNIEIRTDNVNSNNIVYRVTSWISNPESIIYNVVQELKDATNEICSTNPNLETIINKIESLPPPNSYLPMETIPSLRELEGILKGLRWNLAYYIKFMMHNAVYIGSNGRSNLDNALYNKNAGTLYLLHKNKNIDLIPNSVYDERINRDISVTYGEGVGEIISGMIGDNNQDIIPAHTVFLSAAGTWQSVSQCINIRIRTDELW